MHLHRYFYAEGQFLGSAYCGMQYVHGELQLPYHYAYFCPTCGEVWARCPVDGSQKWQLQGGQCRKHPAIGHAVAGSLQLPWDPEFNTSLLALPQAVTWEFARHLECMERIVK